MSMHEIEDLVEESVRLVLAGDRSRDAKVATISELYLVQARFDTSDTTGRLADELAAIGFRDDDIPHSCDLLRLAATLMSEAESAGKSEIAQGWLALVVQAIADLEIGDDIPADFRTMLEAGDAARMREIALRGGLHKIWRKDFFLRVRSWGALKSHYAPLDPHSLERRFILRYLSDAKADEATIRADYDTEKTKIEGLAALPLFTLPVRVPKLAPLVHLGLETSGQHRNFVFADSDAVPARDASRVFVVIEHINALNMMTFEVRVQSGLLLAWQDREGGNDIASTHFRLNVAMLVPEAELNADKDYNPFGGWPFKLTQSSKVLDARLSAMSSHWSHIERVRKFHQTPLDRLLAGSTATAMEQRRRDLRAEFGFFLNDIELLFAYACLEWEAGRRPDALIGAMESELRFVAALYPLKPVWQKGLERLREGPWFPPATEIFPYKRLEASDEA